MNLDEFRDTLKKLLFIDEQPWMGDAFWRRFENDQLRTFLRADDEEAERLWDMIKPAEDERDADIRKLVDRLTTAIEVDARLGDDDVPRVEIVGAEAMIEASFAERDAEIRELKTTVIAFAGPWAVKYAKDRGLPEKHLFQDHYDLLEHCGARMVDFIRGET